MLSLGMPSSVSVYSLRFLGSGLGADFVFCCFGGGSLGFFETRFLELVGVELDLLTPFWILLVWRGFGFVGAIFRGRRWESQKSLWYSVDTT